MDVAAAGVNYIDTYHREGIYPVDTPFILGVEGAGTVTAVGSEAAGFAVGGRVVWQGSLGSYTQRRLVPAEIAVKIPDGISEETAGYVPANASQQREVEKGV